ncbi:MAG TPA: efflux RND transporter periplasmic adaptor subunit [Candidatus Hydrogenedentes bacterium]|nr:efflux RND transporter periplasmic adaptor subunit [Candidatus Hydrogenedentota bacterium]HNT87419.1 efflux RND transporter periplasmic adaptor subunit [Candidatus Hydrogenedentota bacterium]
MASERDAPRRRRLGRWLLRLGAAGILILGIVAGYAMRGWIGPSHPHAPEHAPATAAPKQAQTYTCSMHPQIRQPGPGLCPLCGMDLIPVETGGQEDAGPRTFVTSESAKALMDIATARVERRFVTAEVRMVGKIEYDETRLGYIAAWTPGRIERMYADYTGVVVKQGEHMVDLYSPELLTAKEELLRAKEALARVPAGAPAVLREAAEGMIEAVRNKLRRWGMTEQQIAAAERSGKFGDRITIYAPMSGTVVERSGREGMYVETGTPLYTIADLSVVWVKLDAYESDMPWIHYGQTVEITTEAYPGETFAGRIAFIEPFLNTATRTVKVRVNADNPDGRLRPGMFVRAVVRANVATRGRVMDPGLSGKWISPMHPEVIKDGPGACDVCGMPLVRAEELGYVSATARDEDMPIVIPASAPLITGKRAVVYVEVSGAEKPTFEGRDVVLGPRARDFYLVESGLAEGEIVVTNGNFKIDSALQILAKPSMMQPEADGAPSEEAAPAPARMDALDAFRGQLRGLVEAYYAVWVALANDDGHAAAEGIPALRDALGEVDGALIEGDARTEWEGRRAAIETALDAIKGAGHDIGKQRAAFAPLSTVLIQALEQFGVAGDAAIHVTHCPMAFDKAGADWLQSDRAVRNPYFGASMLQCGAVTRSIVDDTGERRHE